MTTKQYAPIYLDNSGGLVLAGLRDMDGAYVNGATVNCTQLRLEDGGSDVSGITLPLAMPYVAASQGKYRGIIPHDVVLEVGKRYTIRIVADTGTLIATFNHAVVARVRGST